jgi:DNA-binding CsgD family transcriptional regulator
LTSEHLFYIINFAMRLKFLDILLFRLGLKREGGPRYFELDEELQLRLQDLAEQERRPARELPAELIAEGLARHSNNRILMQRWKSLSAREQEVTALTCLGYTNRQMAARLGIAEETVKSHMRNALVKLHLHGKLAVQQALAEWDFSEWEKIIG